MLAATMAPLVVLLGFAYLLVSPRLASAAKAKSNQSKAEHVQLLFNLSNAMQAERDRSAWYVATLGKTDEEGKKSTKRRKEQMLSARQTTGVALDSVNEFEVTLPEGQTTSILADVEAPRVIADSDSPDVDSLINFYNLRLEKVQNSTRSLENSSNAELLTAAAGLTELSIHRSELALVRVFGVIKFANGSFGARDVGVLDSHNKAAEAAFARFLQTQPAEPKSIREALVRRMSGVRSDSDTSMHQIMTEVEGAGTTTVDGVASKKDADEFWREQDPRLNEVDVLQAEKVTEFKDLAGDVASTERSSAIGFAAAALFATLLSALVGLILARSLSRRLADIAEQARYIATEQLPEVLKGLKHPTAEAVTGALPTVRTKVNDELGVMADAFNNVLHTSVRTSLEHSHQRSQTVTAMLVNLGRRNQSLIDRQLKIMDRLESKEEDPDVLEALYEVDHLVTRMRRNAENLLVLSGQKQARTWSKPVSLYDVLRSAAAEVSDLNRVVIADVPHALTMSGPFAVDACHLLAELVENATRYSPKTSLVTLNTSVDSDSVIVSIFDNGVGMNEAELEDANNRLANPPEIDELVADRVGFQVVGRLARKVGTVITLSQNQNGGTIADVAMPLSMFIDANGTPQVGSGPRSEAKKKEQRPTLQAVPALEQSSSSRDRDSAPVAPSIGSKKVGLRENAQPTVVSAPTVAEFAPLELPSRTGGPSVLAPVVSMPVEAAAPPVAPVFVSARTAEKPNVADAVLMDANRLMDARPVAAPNPVAQSVSLPAENLPQRSRRESTPEEVPQFFGRPIQNRPAGPTGGAFAAVKQAKQALLDHEHGAASANPVAPEEIAVPVSVSPVEAFVEAVPVVEAVEADPFVEAVPFIEAPPVVEEIATEEPAPVAPGGLIQRRPGKVFSSAAEAADSGAFRRLGSGADGDDASAPASRFNALSRLQRGVTNARTLDEVSTTETSPEPTTPLESTPTPSLTEQY
jgi:signal transduction histidine kinase